MEDDAVVRPQVPRELVGPRIDGMDAAHAAVQQHVGKAASRRADVDRGRARYVPAQMHPPLFQRVIELDAAARHPRMVATLDADRGLGGDPLPPLVYLSVAYAGEARADTHLRSE